MAKYRIEINDGNIFINDEQHFCDALLDGDPAVDRDKRILLALADHMGYEPMFIFSEIADTLADIVDESFLPI